MDKYKSHPKPFKQKRTQLHQPGGANACHTRK